MGEFASANTQKEFRCSHCTGKIVIPIDLPPTTGPCPHCGGIITSPGPGPEAATPGDPDPEPEIAPLPSRIAPTPPQVGPSPPSSVIPATKMELPPKSETAEHNKPKVSKSPALKKAAKPQRSGVISAMLVLLGLGAAAGAVVYFASKELGRNPDPPVVKNVVGDPAVAEANYIRIGWQKEAYKLLRGYMAGTTAAEKVPSVMNGPQLAAKIEDFYGGSKIIDTDTPADAFSIYELSEDDRKRGLFAMIYDQPPQVEMREFFRPLATLEVQYGIDEADLLLSTLARVGNFAMEPLRVYAFFKRGPEGLKLDWEIFAQTKYRTFQNFVELPDLGQSTVFRVLIIEDVPDKGRAVAGTRTYRIADPANKEDSARVNVKIDSELGRALSIINWRGTKDAKPTTRTVTLELKWSGEATAPELEISRFVCWEFLGLGGQETPATASTK